MTGHLATAQDPLDLVLTGRDVLETLAAGAELAAAAARGAAPDGLVEAYTHGDALARLLVLPALAAVGSDASDAAAALRRRRA